jgi:hypothetical protein
VSKVGRHHRTDQIVVQPSPSRAVFRLILLLSVAYLALNQEGWYEKRRSEHTVFMLAPIPPRLQWPAQADLGPFSGSR